MGRGLGEGSDSEVLSVRTSDLSSDYDPDVSDEESDADVNRSAAVLESCLIL